MSCGPDPITKIQSLLQYVSCKKGGASIFYSLIRDANAPKLASLKLAREKDIGEYTEQQQWSEVIFSWHIPAREVQTQFTD